MQNAAGNRGKDQAGLGPKLAGPPLGLCGYGHSHQTKETGKGKPGSIGGSGTSSTLGKHRCIRGWRLLVSTPPRGGPGRLARTTPVDASLDDSFPNSPMPSLRTTVCGPDYQPQPATLKILSLECRSSQGLTGCSTSFLQMDRMTWPARLQLPLPLSLHYIYLGEATEAGRIRDRKGLPTLRTIPLPPAATPHDGAWCVCFCNHGTQPAQGSDRGDVWVCGPTVSEQQRQDLTFVQQTLGPACLEAAKSPSLGTLGGESTGPSMDISHSCKPSDFQGSRESYPRETSQCLPMLRALRQTLQTARSSDGEPMACGLQKPRGRIILHSVHQVPGTGLRRCYHHPYWRNERTCSGMLNNLPKATDSRRPSWDLSVVPGLYGNAGIQGAQLQVSHFTVPTQAGLRKALGMPVLLLRGSEGPSEATRWAPRTVSFLSYFPLLFQPPSHVHPTWATLSWGD
ncbi:hypothetical protein Cadr_000009125 [Camelus dromedarius]|uniref:Uncharacterized protein n=1 Tax=Camelus dromedarius TaxID=9838 RepID=A0A5N4DKR5_CAMDR|nr:hypothetical protein Cadr_000009125 [Camelus dromedarius]